MKLVRILSSVLLTGLVSMSTYGAQIDLTPADMVINPLVISNTNCENSTPSCVNTAFGLPDTTVLSLLYKADVDAAPGDSGSFASSYMTTFNNTPTDPADALIEYVSGAVISCPACYLAVKDGNSAPYYYFYNLASWNGTDSISLTGFWPNQGAISHVSIWGLEVPRDVSEPSILMLMGLGLLTSVGLSRRRKLVV